MSEDFKEVLNQFSINLVNLLRSLQTWFKLY